MSSVYLILHNIRSVHNVASIFRTADAAGVAHVYLTGYTPAPVDRFGRIRRDFAKVSLGAEHYVPWEKRKNIRTLIRELKRKGVSVIALEQDADAVGYAQVKMNGSTALILGNETNGISTAILKQCDVIAEIPMRGKKESLNVSVAAGIALFQMFGGRK